ncbi:MAG: DUF3108 domain-containing protein [Candidatus Kapabacteria bacterium]|nr:DUF3108 domain-containing protein [Ignavibacteriota bacterium]MCW5883433.1 DUF3108 domain-containing protein [Candidatus Kapabacteria bacterium]
MKYFFILVVFLTSFYSGDASVLLTGEFLEYNVTYLGVSIANVKIYNDGWTNHGKRSVVKVRANIFTYSHIPMINAKVRMESLIDRGGIYSHEYVRNISLRNNPWEYQKIEFNYSQNLLKNNKWINNKKTSSINLEFEPTYRIHDALGLFFKARFAATPGNSSKILTYLDESPFYTNINFSSKKELIYVGGVSGKVRSVYGKGNADWQKQFGITGEFEGWFSDDSARIPLKGKLDFIVGKLSIELVKYQRDGWQVPR